MYKKNVKHCIDECNKRLYDNPPKNSEDLHAIKFSQLDDQAYSDIKHEMVEFTKKSGSSINSPAQQNSGPSKFSKT